MKQGVKLIAVSLCITIIFLFGCSKTDADFQKDADILRLQHLKYYGELLVEYYKKSGKFPFQSQESVPVYVHVANDEQIEFTKQGPPYPHKVVAFKEFVKEIEMVTGKRVNGG